MREKTPRAMTDVASRAIAANASPANVNDALALLRAIDSPASSTSAAAFDALVGLERFFCSRLAAGELEELRAADVPGVDAAALRRLRGARDAGVLRWGVGRSNADVGAGGAHGVLSVRASGVVFE